MVENVCRGCANCSCGHRKTPFEIFMEGGEAAGVELISYNPNRRVKNVTVLEREAKAKTRTTPRRLTDEESLRRFKRENINGTPRARGKIGTEKHGSTWTMVNGGDR